MSLQLPPNLQRQLPEDRLPQTKLYEDHQPGSLSTHTCFCPSGAWDVQGHLCALPRLLPFQHPQQCPCQVSSLQKSVQCGTGVCQDQVDHLPHLWPDRSWHWHWHHCGNPTLRGREGGTVRRLRRRLPGGGPPPPPQPLLLCHEDQPDRGAHLEHHRGLLRASQNALPFIILFLAKSSREGGGHLLYPKPPAIVCLYSSDLSSWMQRDETFDLFVKIIWLLLSDLLARSVSAKNSKFQRTNQLHWHYSMNKHNSKFQRTNQLHWHYSMN